MEFTKTALCFIDKYSDIIESGDLVKVNQFIKRNSEEAGGMLEAHKIIYSLIHLLQYPTWIYPNKEEKRISWGLGEITGATKNTELDAFNFYFDPEPFPDDPKKYVLDSLQSSLLYSPVWEYFSEAIQKATYLR